MLCCVYFFFKLCLYNFLSHCLSCITKWNNSELAWTPRSSERKLFSSNKKTSREIKKTMQTAMDKRIETVKSRFKRVCVFCGSSSGNKDCYRDAAIDLAQELVLLCLLPKWESWNLVMGHDFFFSVLWNRLRGNWISCMEEEALVSWVWSHKLFMKLEDMY